MKITILGQTPPKKNSKRILTNSKTGKPFIASSKIAKEWETSALWQLKKFYGLKFRYPIAMKCTFYLKDLRKRDLSNMLDSVQDALVKAGVIEDDSWKHLCPVIIDCAGVDPEPRCEIILDCDVDNMIL